MSDIHYFGIRHLSPNSSHNLIKLLDVVNPDCVLIESPIDLNEQIENIINENTKPPIAIMAYTLSSPVQSVLYPLAVYSPEYQAMLWAKKNNKPIKCIDLPSSMVLAFDALNHKRKMEQSEQELLENAKKDIENNSIDPYQEIATKFGCKNYDEFWEIYFEHLDLDKYQEAILSLAENLRAIDSRDDFDFAYNHIREAHMKRIVEQTKTEFGEKCKLVVATGAFHTPFISNKQTKGLTDKEFATLPNTSSNLTIIPYSYKRLSSRSGYGAGNNAPAYYEMLFELMQNNSLHDLAPLYMTQIANEIRTANGIKSSAEVIDATRLSLGLANIKNSQYPSLYDLRDSAITCLGGGLLSTISEAVAKVEIGQGIGRLAKNSKRTAIQEDFYKQLSRLKLDKYLSPFISVIELDLRENVGVKNLENAFVGLERSRFFNMLKFLGINFCKEEKSTKAKTWSEAWQLCWAPECEIELVECSIIGETIENACSSKISDLLSETASLDETAKILDACLRCGLTTNFKNAKETLIKLSIKGVDFSALADTISTLSRIIKYGDIRRIDTSELLPLLEELFLRASLEAVNASSCSNEVAINLAESFSQVDATAQSHYDFLDDSTWIDTLTKLTYNDSINPIISGYACAILLDRKKIDDAAFRSIILKRLSNGTPADLGAGWFMGLAKKNKFSLLARTTLWKNLDEYVSTLDPEQFKKAVVFLRRAFSSFSPSDKVAISETLANIWGINKHNVIDALSRDVSQKEIDEINSAFNDFDLGDI